MWNCIGETWKKEPPGPPSCSFISTWYFKAMWGRAPAIFLRTRGGLHACGEMRCSARRPGRFSVPLCRRRSWERRCNFAGTPRPREYALSQQRNVFVSAKRSPCPFSAADRSQMKQPGILCCTAGCTAHKRNNRGRLRAQGRDRGFVSERAISGNAGIP